jgi:hypothetical protein
MNGRERLSLLEEHEVCISRRRMEGCGDAEVSVPHGDIGVPTGRRDVKATSRVNRASRCLTLSEAT